MCCEFPVVALASAGNVDLIKLFSRRGRGVLSLIAYQNRSFAFSVVTGGYKSCKIAAIFLS